MKIADLIDLDQQLRLASEDRGQTPRRRLERDRQIGREFQLTSDGFGREELLLQAWTRNVSPTAGPSIGGVVAGAVRWTAFVLLILGFGSGAAAAAALLHYDGTQPINVLFFLGVLVGGQLLLLPLLALSFLFRRRFRGGFKFGMAVIGGLLKWMVVLSTRLGVSPQEASRIRGDIGNLRATHSLFAQVQPLLLLCLIQVFGIAFNQAVAGTLFFLVLFTDLTFSWGTTLEVEPEQIHAITSVLALPWAGYLPEASPTLELVEATRFARIESAFVGDEPGAALRAGGWWPFLLASLLTYGFLPRVIALGGGLYFLRREIGLALSRSEQVQALKERLRSPVVTVDRDEPKETDGPVARNESARTGEKPVEKGLDVAVIFWAYDETPPRETVDGILAQTLGAKATMQILAGDLETPEQLALERVHAARTEGKIGGAVVFFEPFEPPKKDARRFLARLREVLGAAVPVVVFLGEFEADGIRLAKRGDWESWNDAVRGAGDPFLVMHQRTMTTGTKS